MDLVKLAAKLTAAVAPHDLLSHPFYQAWNMGELTREDLRAYAAQYKHQVDALPDLLTQAQRQTADAVTQAALERNLSEELGQIAHEGATEIVPHRELWMRFANGMGASRDEVESCVADAETRAAVDGLHAVVGQGGIESLAALWTYEMQTAKVSHTKHEGLVSKYGVTDTGTLSFFKAHEELDQHHAADLLAALARACDAPTEEQFEQNLARACEAASKSAVAQWTFLDGAQARRAKN
ncbi:MAG: iron-containing redox enzyme family protein [Deltaproteobacteria bacterium]|nr:iron-containing redox enzyme family protein [Deltaproteobacteria bacterium]